MAEHHSGHEQMQQPKLTVQSPSYSIRSCPLAIPGSTTVRTYIPVCMIPGLKKYCETSSSNGDGMTLKNRARNEKPEKSIAMSWYHAALWLYVCVLDFFQVCVRPPVHHLTIPIPFPIPIPIPTKPKPKSLEFDSRKKVPLDKRSQQRKENSNFRTKRRRAIA
jgi:hypothetical protein